MNHSLHAFHVLVYSVFRFFCTRIVLKLSRHSRIMDLRELRCSPHWVSPRGVDYSGIIPTDLFATFLNSVGLLVTYTSDTLPIFDLRTPRGALDFPAQVNTCLSNELKLGRIVGPIDTVPFPQGLMASPLNTVEKSDLDRGGRRWFKPAVQSFSKWWHS